MNRATRIKVYIKSEKFSFPIPALRFSTVRWISRIALKWIPKAIEEADDEKNKITSDILKRIRRKDIDLIIDQLQQEPPFEMVDIETEDEKDGNIIVKIYTL